MTIPNEGRVLRLGQMEGRRVRIVADEDMAPDADATWRVIADGKATGLQSMPFVDGELVVGELGRTVSIEHIEIVDPGNPILEGARFLQANWSGGVEAVGVLVEAARQSFDEGSVTEIRVPVGTNIQAEGVASALEVMGMPGSVEINDSGQVILDLRDDSESDIKVSNCHCLLARLGGSREVDVKKVAEAHVSSERSPAIGDLPAYRMPTWTIDNVEFLQLGTEANTVVLTGSGTMAILVAEGENSLIDADIRSRFIRLDTFAGGSVNLEGSADMLLAENSGRVDIAGEFGSAYIEGEDRVDLSNAYFTGEVVVDAINRREPMEVNTPAGYSPLITAISDQVSQDAGGFHLNGDWELFRGSTHLAGDVTSPARHHANKFHYSMIEVRDQLASVSPLQLRTSRQMPPVDTAMPLRDSNVRTQAPNAGRSGRYGASTEPNDIDLPPTTNDGPTKGPDFGY
jgi:hypothetical protein